MVGNRSWFDFGIEDLVPDSDVFNDDLTYDLNNPIHPIFARTNFQCADYEALVPALRLASYFLTTPCLLSYYHAILCGELCEREHPADSLVGYSRSEWSFFRKEELTASDVAKTRDALGSLARLTRFYEEDEIVAHACCQWSDDRTAGGEVPGYCPDIHFSNELSKSLGSYGNGSTQTTYAMLVHHFLFAQVMLHEIAHAAYIATHSKSKTYVTFEHATICEEGFDWESSVFGGIMNPKHGCSTVSEWPSARVLHEVRSGATCWSQGLDDQIQSNPAMPLTVIHWKLSHQYVVRLFTTKFWEVEVPRVGAEALRVPQILGCRSWLQLCKCCCCGRIRKVLSGEAVGWKEQDDNGDRICDKAKDDCTKEKDCKLAWNWLDGQYSREYDADAPDGYRLSDDGTIVSEEYYERLLGLKNRQAGLPAPDQEMY